MKTKGTIEKKGNKIIIEADDKYADKRDPNAPWVKKTVSYKIDPSKIETVFDRYIAFYSTTLSSAIDNIITTERLLAIGETYGMNKTVIRRCILRMVALGELIKYESKRGIFMINPQHISYGQSVEASRALIKQAEAIQNTTNIQHQDVTINVYSESSTLLKDLIEKQNNKIINL